MSWLRTTLLYSLLLFAAAVVAGFAFGVINRIAGIEHAWGELDAGAVIPVTITFAVSFGVFFILSKQHPRAYYSIGVGVVILTAILSTASAYALAPPAARASQNWLAIPLWPMLFNIAALLIAGLVLRLRRSSSNTSLERTRER